MIEPPPTSPVSPSESPPPPPVTAPARANSPANIPPAASAGWSGRLAKFTAVPVAHQPRNFAIGGAVLGALVGLGRATALHVPPGGIAIAALRMAAAGA